MKVFYSWQMDAPRKINKDFIHGALSDAIARLGEELDVASAERAEIELDQDTQGVLGSPEISRVIFEKIAASRVVVTDVSLVARGPDGKPHINSNVAIELGFAYGKNGDEPVLKIMNTHYGRPEQLPFDLRIRRHPVQYELAPDADKDEIAAKRRQLAAQLAIVLQAYVEKADPKVAHVERPSVGQRGRFWNANEPLIPKAESGSRSSDVYWQGESVLYFRCIPQADLPALTSLEAYDLSAELTPLVWHSGYSRARNKWGVIVYDRGSGGDALIGATQLFKNREIWAIDATYSQHSINSEEEDGSEPRRIVPTGAVQRDYPRAIDSIRKNAAKLGYGESYIVEMGFSGAEGVYLAINGRHWNPFPGPFFDPELFMRKTIPAEYPTGQLMNDFWDKLFSEVGRKVPSDLVWQPDSISDLRRG